jgi:hypothetical protein
LSTCWSETADSRQQVPSFPARNMCAWQVGERQAKLCSLFAEGDPLLFVSC